MGTRRPQAGPQPHQGQPPLALRPWPRLSCLAPPALLSTQPCQPAARGGEKGRLRAWRQGTWAHGATHCSLEHLLGQVLPRTLVCPEQGVHGRKAWLGGPDCPGLGPEGAVPPHLCRAMSPWAAAERRGSNSAHAWGVPGHRASSCPAACPTARWAGPCPGDGSMAPASPSLGCCSKGLANYPCPRRGDPCAATWCRHSRVRCARPAARPRGSAPTCPAGKKPITGQEAHSLAQPLPHQLGQGGQGGGRPQVGPSARPFPRPTPRHPSTCAPAPSCQLAPSKTPGQVGAEPRSPWLLGQRGAHLGDGVEQHDAALLGDGLLVLQEVVDQQRDGGEALALQPVQVLGRQAMPSMSHTTHKPCVQAFTHHAHICSWPQTHAYPCTRVQKHMAWCIWGGEGRAVQQEDQPGSPSLQDPPAPGRLRGISPRPRATHNRPGRLRARDTLCLGSPLPGPAQCSRRWSG